MTASRATLLLIRFLVSGPVSSPRAVAVLSTGDAAVISALRSPSAALVLLGLVLHDLALVQGMVEAVVYDL